MTAAERVLNHGAGPPQDDRPRRADTCPDCAAERWETLIPVPGVFYCDACKRASAGPNSEAPARGPEQATLFA